MDRICPFLALDTDRRTVVDGFDPDHLCRAVSPPDAVDRGTQVQLCLQAGHRQCERFKERTSALTVPRDIPRPAPDAAFTTTRLVIRPEAGSWRAISRPIPSPRPARMVAAGAAAVAVLGGVAAATTAGFGLFAAPSGPPVASPLAAGTASTAPTPTAVPSATPTPQPTQSATATPTRPPATPAPTPRPTPRIYIVQSGDTLNGIAARFGVTVAALREANGLSGDTILIGQSLVIP